MGTVPAEDPYQQSIQVILREGGGFANSAEFEALIGTAEDLPGVVASAYARYASRRLRAGGDPDELMKPLNLLASMNHDRIDIMLREEPLEQMEADGILGIVRSAFNGRLAELSARITGDSPSGNAESD